jgi:hypothetical protein
MYNIFSIKAIDDMFKMTLLVLYACQWLIVR